MRNQLVGAIAALCLAVPAIAAPGDMDLATFLAKADKLEKRGVGALLSSDLKLLRKEVEGAAEDYRKRIVADRAAQRTPHSCPPPKGKAKLGSNEMLAHMRSYPAARRSSTTVRTAFLDMMKQRFPCT